MFIFYLGQPHIPIGLMLVCLGHVSVCKLAVCYAIFFYDIICDWCGTMLIYSHLLFHSAILLVSTCENIPQLNIKLTTTIKVVA